MKFPFFTANLLPALLYAGTISAAPLQITNDSSTGGAGKFAVAEIEHEAILKGMTLGDDANATRISIIVEKESKGAAQSYGIQICELGGRVLAFIPTPNGKCSNLTFGGPEMNIIYATCGDKVYKRKVKAKGVEAMNAPMKPESKYQRE